MGSEQWVAETGIAVPPTRVFCEKRLQAVENKGLGWKKREKRLQEIDRSRVRAGATGGTRGLPARELRDLGGDEGDHGEG